jgi:hypothetical protein
LSQQKYEPTRIADFNAREQTLRLCLYVQDRVVGLEDIGQNLAPEGASGAAARNADLVDVAQSGGAATLERTAGGRRIGFDHVVGA